VGEPFGGVAGCVGACFKSKDTFDEMYDLVETPLKCSRDIFAHKDFPNIGFTNIVLPNPLDHSHVSPMSSLLSPFPEYHIDLPIDNPIICDANVDLGYEEDMFSMQGGNVDNFVSLGCFGGYDRSIDPYTLS